MNEVNEANPASETSGVERLVIPPICVEIELQTINQIRNILVDAIGNSEELLFLHDQSLGRTTKKNQMTAEMYEREIANSRNMLAILGQC